MLVSRRWPGYTMLPYKLLVTRYSIFSSFLCFNVRFTRYICTAKALQYLFVSTNSIVNILNKYRLE